MFNAIKWIVSPNYRKGRRQIKLEKLLREHGASRKEAKRIISQLRAKSHCELTTNAPQYSCAWVERDVPPKSTVKAF